MTQQDEIQHRLTADKPDWVPLQGLIGEGAGAPAVNQQAAGEVATLDDPAKVGHVLGRYCRPIPLALHGEGPHAVSRDVNGGQEPLLFGDEMAVLGQAVEVLLMRRFW